MSFAASHFLLPNVDYDTISYQMVGNLILHGQGIYPGIALGHFPYFSTDDLPGSVGGLAVRIRGKNSTNIQMHFFNF